MFRKSLYFCIVLRRPLGAEKKRCRKRHFPFIHTNIQTFQEPIELEYNTIKTKNTQNIQLLLQLMYGLFSYISNYCTITFTIFFVQASAIHVRHGCNPISVAALTLSCWRFRMLEMCEQDRSWYALPLVVLTTFLS